MIDTNLSKKKILSIIDQHHKQATCALDCLILEYIEYAAKQAGMSVDQFERIEASYEDWVMLDDVDKEIITSAKVKVNILNHLIEDIEAFSIPPKEHTE